MDLLFYFLPECFKDNMLKNILYSHNVALILVMFPRFQWYFIHTAAGASLLGNISWGGIESQVFGHWSVSLEIVLASQRDVWSRLILLSRAVSASLLCICSARLATKVIFFFFYKFWCIISFLLNFMACFC